MSQVLSVTEKGEQVVTAGFLLDILGSIVHHSFAVRDFDGPTSAYICATLNLLGHQGLIEVKGARPGKPGSKPPVDTTSPPSWITEAFKAEGGGDAKTEG